VSGHRPDQKICRARLTNEMEGAVGENLAEASNVTFSKHIGCGVRVNARLTVCEFVSAPPTPSDSKMRTPTKWRDGGPSGRRISVKCRSRSSQTDRASRTRSSKRGGEAVRTHKCNKRDSLVELHVM
jgi:hypothetical protein